MIYQIAICDDEEMMVKINRMYLQKAADEKGKKMIIHTFSSGESLLKYAAHGRLDIVFLDVEMPHMDGLETAEVLGRMQKDVVIVFITGYQEYAYSAFSVDAVDYLMKPLTAERMEKALRKAMDLVLMKKNKNRNAVLVITENNIKIKVRQYKILYIEKAGNQCILHTLEGRRSCYKSIREIRMELEPCFWQINQGVVVNSKYIQKIEGEEIFLDGCGAFVLGRKYKADIKARFYELYE